MIKLVVDNKAGNCVACGKGVYRDDDLFVSPYRPISFFHKKCFKDLLKKHPLSIAHLHDLV
tara:strand:+ start:9856 stop:10038 length:183 start_codon:yes stop_codon:yes gene_type:complete